MQSPSPTRPPVRASHQEERRRRQGATTALLDEARTTPPGPGREALLNQVVVVNRGVAQAVASHFRDRGVAQEDLEQTAYEALLKAVRRFDPERSEDLLTFAVPTIRGELQRYFRDLGWMVRPPRRLQRLRYEIGACVDELTQDLGHEPSRSEVVDHLGISAADYDECQQVLGCHRPSSLDQPAHDGSASSLGDLLPADGAGEPGEERVLVTQLLATLTDRERLIVALRFDQDLTQAEIGERIGVTQMQVSRLLSGILQRLRLQVDDDAQAPAAQGNRGR